MSKKKFWSWLFSIVLQVKSRRNYFWHALSRVCHNGSFHLFFILCFKTKRQLHTSNSYSHLMIQSIFWILTRFSPRTIHVSFFEGYDILFLSPKWHKYNDKLCGQQASRTDVYISRPFGTFSSEIKNYDFKPVLIFI